MSHDPDRQEELVDLVDPVTGVPTGKTAPRRVVHRDGLWHATFHLWVVRRGDPDVVLLQRRSASCTAAPREFDMAVGGHLLAGETPAAGVREAREEIGLEVAFDDLQPLGARPTEWTRPGLRDREIAHVFLHETTRGAADFRPDPEELEGLFEVPLHGLIELLEGRTPTCSARGVAWNGTAYDPSTHELQRADVVVSDCGYPLPVLHQIAARLAVR